MATPEPTETASPPHLCGRASPAGLANWRRPASRPAAQAISSAMICADGAPAMPCMGVSLPVAEPRPLRHRRAGVGRNDQARRELPSRHAGVVVKGVNVHGAASCRRGTSVAESTSSTTLRRCVTSSLLLGAVAGDRRAKRQRRGRRIVHPAERSAAWFFGRTSSDRKAR